MFKLFRFISAGVLCALLIAPNTVIFAGNKTSVIYNGQIVQDADVTFKSERTFVTFSPLLKAMGLNYKWNQESNQLTVHSDNTELKLQLGKKVLELDGLEIDIDVAPFAKNGRIYVPVLYISKYFGCSVFYDKKIDQIQVNKVNASDGKEEKLDPNELERILLLDSLIISGYTLDRVAVPNDSKDEDRINLDGIAIRLELQNTSTNAIETKDLTYELSIVNSNKIVSTGNLYEASNEETIAPGKAITITVFGTAYSNEVLKLRIYAKIEMPRD